MFGNNKIISPVFYKNQHKNTVTVTSIFYTLQGEGPFRGEAAAFVRLTGCNRSCTFCDTYFDSGDELTFDQINEKIMSKVNAFHYGVMDESTEITSDNKTDNLLVVITGGEPMIQPNLAMLIDFLHDRGYRTQIESNGDFLRNISPETTLVVSPKAHEFKGYAPLRGDVFTRANALKFVVCADKTSVYYNIPEYAHDFRRENKPVFISPMNMYARLPDKVGNNGTLEMRSDTDERISFWTEGLLDQPKNQENHEYAALLAMKYNMTLNLQTHLYASLP